MSEEDLRIECPSCGNAIAADSPRCPKCGAELYIAGLDELEELARYVTDPDWLEQPSEEFVPLEVPQPPEIEGPGPVEDVAEVQASPVEEVPEIEEPGPVDEPDEQEPEPSPIEEVVEVVGPVEEVPGPEAIDEGIEDDDSEEDESGRKLSRKEKKALKRQMEEEERKRREVQEKKDAPPLEVLWEKIQEDKEIAEEREEEAEEGSGIIKKLFGRRKA